MFRKDNLNIKNIQSLRRAYKTHSIENHPPKAHDESGLNANIAEPIIVTLFPVEDDSSQMYGKYSEDFDKTKGEAIFVPNEDIKRMKQSICLANTKYSVIRKVSKSLGFKLVRDTKLCNILWTDSIPGTEVFKNMKRFQQINHFPGMIEICRKDLLSRNLNRMLKLYPSDYDIFPKTWVFPADLGAAIAFGKKHKHKTFILKPDHCAQGHGISLTNDLSAINPNDRMICQLYINEPLLIDGFKFDLRIYTLITSIDPLRIFVYNEGLARFATKKFNKPSPCNTSDLFMHLTNYAVNKHSADFSKCEEMGSKRNFKTINRLLKSKGYDVDLLWQNIDDIIVKTILSAWPMLRHNYHACFKTHDKIQACFEILGFDILVDAKLKPYILEVNHSPSFHTNQSVDHHVKNSLIRDTLTLVGTTLADKHKIMREDRKRAIRRLLRKEEKTDKNNLELLFSESTLSPLAQQIAWEESHLGDFRRIMPAENTGELNEYCQFFNLQNQASVYSDTLASKHREYMAKNLRLALDQKRDKLAETIKNLKKTDKIQKTLSRTATDEIRKKRMQHYEKWEAPFISNAGEHLRIIAMNDRSQLVDESNMFAAIFQIFYKMGNLQESDIEGYPNLYGRLQENEFIYDTVSE